MDSLHYQLDRKNRHDFIIKNIGYGKPIRKKIVDKGHINGAEIHLITDTGIIIVYNAKTKIHVTDMIARPTQLERYNCDSWICPAETLAKAAYHQAKGWNNI